MTVDDARPAPSLAMIGAAALRLLTQVEECLARRPRAPRDPGLAAALAYIRQEADDLIDLYGYLTRPGLCAHCGSVDVPLTAAMSADPGREVCEACALDPELATLPLSALADDSAVWVVTRGDAVWLAGRELTDGEVSRLAAAIGDATADAVARVVAGVCGS